MSGTIETKVDTGKWFAEWDIAKNNVLKVSVECLKDISTQLYRKVIDYTPVGNPTLWKYPPHKDYKPGTLKASWGINYGSNEVSIFNYTPYAGRVEYGWSTQTPNGMLRRAILDFPALAEQVIKANQI